VSNLLIVESENDKYFIEALINHLNLNLEVGSPICSIDDYKCLGGIGKLEEKLNEIKAIVAKDGIEIVGIIFDADSVGVERRKSEIEEKISLVFGENSDVRFEIYIMNVDGFGELETILKLIYSKDATIANCLEKWQDCLPEDKRLNQKEFDKFWIQIYQRYDCCSKKEAKQAGKKCNNKTSLKEKDIWNFEHEILDDLKEFLKIVGANNDNTTSD
jgi:hypothetical protein